MAYDLLGQRFGKLTVRQLLPDRSHRERHWLCECDCGNRHIATSSNLIRGKTWQCTTCSRNQGAETNNRGLSHPARLRRIYNGMISRCYNPDNPQYCDYGGRGISVCEEWRKKKGAGYTAFKSWAFSNGYSKILSIDRIDNNGDYSPDNCRWATAIEQANNRRNNRLIEYNGEVNTMAGWARETGIDYFTLRARIDGHGWSVERALSTPPTKRRRKNRCC